MGITKNNMRALLLTLLVAVGAATLYGGYQTFYKAAYPLKYIEAVGRASGDTGVSEALLYAVIRTESGFRENAESSVRACGLMQITPDTLNWVRYRLGENEEPSPQLIFEPEANINYGAHNLALLLREFDDLSTALAAYHAGWGNVKKWLVDDRYSADGQLKSIPFSDTDCYVDKVISTAGMYRQIYGLS